MFSNQDPSASNKPITSIVDHLFKEFLAKKSEMLQHQNSDTTEKVEKEKRHHIEDKAVKGSKQLSKAATHDISEHEQDTGDMTEHSDPRRHDGKHEKKKDKKHKKHKHKDHSRKKHKHHRHDSEREHSTERFGSSERKIATEGPSAPGDRHSKYDSKGKHADEIGRRCEDSVASVSDDLSADSKNDRQHGKHKQGDRKLGVTGCGTVLEHLWQEEDNVSNASSGDLTETTRDPNLHDESTTESEPAPNATGVSWMTLPKELERNPEVNCDTWMKLPDNLTDLEKDKASDNDQVESVGMDVGSDDPRNDKDQCAVPKLKLDMKVDITKVAKVLPPPADITKKVVSSIKKTLISDSHKSEQPPVNSAEVPNEAKIDVSCEKSIDSSSKSEEPVAPKTSSGKMKLGIKISESSAALISSGKKADEEPHNTKVEEGEIIDPVPSNDKGCTAEKHSDKDSSSELTVSQLSSSASVSGSESDNTKSRKKGKKHKKKKKKGHKRKKRAKSPSRGRSWKKHRHSRSRSTSRSRSRSRQRSRSRSRSRCRSRSRKGIQAKSYDEEHGVWRSRSRSRGHKRSRTPEYYRPSRYNYSRYRSKSRDHHHDHHRAPYYHRHRSRSRSWSRSRSRSPVSRNTSHEERLKIDKAELRKIAFQNAYAHLRKGDLPNIGLKPAEVAALKAGGKSVEELTDFCKKIAEKGDSLFPSDDSDTGGKENNSDNEAPFVHHPFRTRENTNIVMNIRNARQLPVLSSAQKQALGNELRLQFPVSSGTHHRDKEREWVPVEHTSGQTTSTAAAASVTSADGKPSTPGSTAPAVTGQVKPDDKVFQDVPNVQISIKDVVSERLNALRKLNENPNDPQAMGAMHKAQEAMNKWVQSRDLPGYFTGSTGANVLSQAELAGMHQAWARKDQLLNAAPVSDGIGKFLLKKMGWKEGEGLGKEGAGSKEPLMLDFKLDRKGLASSGESTKKTPTIPVTKDLSNKHPVSALVELCNRRKWQPPNFVLVHESGPDHKKNFLFKVIVNGSEYQSTIVSTNKKHAKAQAATVCLQQLGLIPQ